LLSLLIASAKGSVDTQQAGVEQLVTDVIELDHQLDAFGPETKHVRQGLRAAMVGLHDRISSPAGVNFETLDPRAMERQYVILELNTPFSGLMRMSDAPIRYALSRVGQ
jgi:hypothetical protein